MVENVEERDWKRKRRMVKRERGSAVRCRAKLVGEARER